LIFFPVTIIDLINSYNYKFNNVIISTFRDICQIVELGKDRLGIINLSNEFLVYNTRNIYGHIEGVFLFTILDTDMIDLYLTVLDNNRIIIAYVKENNSYSEIRDSTTGDILQIITNIAVEGVIILLDKMIVLQKGYIYY
jgi:hypothetical protein